MPTTTLKRYDPQSLGLIPVDDEEKKRKKKQQDFSPEALGLIPLARDDDPADDSFKDFSPEALGLVPTDQPAPEPAPAEAEPEPYTLDWAGHKAWQFIEDVGKSLLGEAPPPANANMERVAEYEEPREERREQPVPEGKLFAPGGVPDAVVPDIIERPLRDIYDWFNSERTTRNLDAGGYTSVSSVDHMIANAAMLGRHAKDFVLEQTGLPHNPESDEDWVDFEAGMRKHSERAQELAMRARLPESERDFTDALVEAVPQLPAMLSQYGGASALMGPIAGFAAVDALHAADQGPEAAAWAGAKGAAMGAFFEWTQILSKPLQMTALGAAGGGLAAAEGASDADIAAQAILFPALAIPARSGPIGMRYLREHGVTADLRDMGAHVRDLLVGGNTGRSEMEMRTQGDALTKVRTRHEEERQAEQARYVVADSEGKVMQPGETQAEVNERLSRLRGEHESNVAEMARRHEKEEQPFRHSFEMAERRHQRAQHPFRMPMSAAPYMRALHSAERGVVVAHTNGYAQIQNARTDADARYAELQKEAETYRERAKQGTPEEATRDRDLADQMEMEGSRLKYEMVRRVEEEIEVRLTKAEQAAEKWRDRLVEAIAHGNKIEGRRAAWLANYRSMQDAYRAGIRLVRSGETRARELIAMGDKHMEITRRRLAERGITEDLATKGEFDAAMARAEETRSSYKELASVELLEAQYRADSRVSRAQRKFDVAVEAAREAGVSRDKLPNRRATAEENTRPEDAKKNEGEWDLPDEDGSVRRGVDYETAYRKALEGSRDDPVLGEIVKDLDPLIARIQDPADVLPAIARIAKALGYEPASTRGKQTAAKREILAERLGLTEEEFLKSPYGKAFSDYELEAATMLLDRSWQRLQQAYRSWKDDPGSEIAARRARLELMRFLMIRNRLRGAAAEAGRSLRMFRELKKKYGGITEPLTDAQFDKIMTFDKMGDAGKLAEKFARGDWFGGIMDFYIQGLLSSLQTLFVNIYSGLGMTMYKPMQSAVAAGIGMTRWGVWNFVLRPMLRPLIDGYRATARTGVLGRKEAERAFARGERFSRPSEFVNFDRVRLGESLARMRGVIEAFPQAVIQFFKAWFTGDKFLGETNYGYTRSRFFDHAATPGRLIGAIDDFFKVLMYRAGVRAHAYRTAIAESQNMGMGGPGDFVKYRARVRERYRELVRNPSERINAEAKKEALEGTYQNEPSLLKGTGQLVEQNPALKFLIPFRKVLLNTVEWQLKGTPFAFLFQKAKMDLLGFNGRIAQDMAMAHMIIVSGGATVIMMWALSGNVREASDQTGPRAINSISGVPPLALRVPGTDDWVTLNRVDPMGGMVSLGVAAARAIKQAHVSGDEDAAQKAFSILVTSAFQMTLNRAGLQGLSDFLEAFQGGSYGNDYNSVNQYMEKIVATLTVPQAIAVDARTTDPYLRYARTQMEQLMNRTRWRSDLWPVRNMWGDPIKAYGNYEQGRRWVGPDGRMYDLDYMLNITQPFYWGKLSKDPATATMMKLYELYRWAPGPVQRTISGRRLTDQEYDFYAKRAGNLQYERMKALAAGPQWNEAEQIERDLKAHRKKKPSEYGGGHDSAVRQRYRVWEAEEKRLAEDLRKKRYAVFLKARNEMAAARKQARIETAGSSDGKTRGAFPDIWTRRKTKDLSRTPGELPDHLDALFKYMNAEDEQEEWDADDEAAHDEDAPDPRDPYGDLKRWREQDRQ